MDGRPRQLGRYRVLATIAHGGMATVHLARASGPAGFERVVALKRLHAQVAMDPECVAMLLDEARLAAQIRHPNVVAVLDLATVDDEVAVVMEYVEGDSLANVCACAASRRETVPIGVAVALMIDVLSGLDAAHEATSPTGAPLEIVHRDVSPQNVLVGIDGLARVVDFGIAKAVGRSRTTRDGGARGKLGYMAPEQLNDESVSRRTDLYAATVVLWEVLVGRRLFQAQSDASLLARVLTATVPPPSQLRREIPEALDRVVLRGLARDTKARFATGREMVAALESAAPVATRREVAAWVGETVGDMIAEKGARLSRALSQPGEEDPSEAAARPTTETAPKLRVTGAPAASVTPPAAPRAVGHRRRASGAARPLVRRVGLGLAAVAVALVVGAAATIAVRGVGGEPQTNAADASSREVTALVVRPPELHVASSAPSNSAPSDTSRPEPSETSRKHAPRVPARGVRGARPLPTRDCAQLYAVDDAGMRHVKRECL